MAVSNATTLLRASTTARLFMIFAILLVGAFALTGAITYVATGRTAENGIRDRVALDMQAMAVEIDTEGVAGLVSAIRARAELPGALGYRLQGPDGAVVIDDLHIDRPVAGWMRVEAVHRDGDHTATLLILSQPLADGWWLSVGDDLQQSEAVRDAVFAALGWSGAAVLLLGLAGAALATRRSLARMRLVSDAVRNFAAGDHGARAPRTDVNRGDDIDAIAAGVNDMLDTIATLAASVRRVSTAVAHDLRTPLAHVRQRLDRLTGDAASAAARGEDVLGAQAEIDAIMRTFDAILSLSEIESAGPAEGLEPVDLAALAENIAEAYSADIEESGRIVQTKLEPELWIRGDRYLLGRAIANLLENAMRHTPPGTQIRIEAARTADDITLSVADNGAGIPAAERLRALEPFYRLDRSRATQGSGLGLAIVAAIAKRHQAALLLTDAKPGLEVRLVFRSCSPAAS